MNREIFKNTFLGEEVELLINMSHKMVEETQDGTLISESPLATTGFILDMDDEYCYLGKTPDEVTKAIRFDFIIGVEIVKAKDLFNDVLDEFEVPEGSQGN